MNDVNAPSHPGLACALLVCLAGVAIAVAAEWPHPRLEPDGWTIKSPPDQAGPAFGQDALLALMQRGSPSFSAGETNGPGPFYTTVFEPPPKPEPKETPPPPPPEPRRIELIYRGLYENERGERQAFISVDGALVSGPVGTALLSDLDQGIMIGAVSIDSATLTRSDGTTIQLEFRKPFTLEVPR